MKIKKEIIYAFNRLNLKLLGIDILEKGFILKEFLKF